MKVPEQINPTGLADYLEVLTKAVFRSGMSWQAVEAKWEGFRQAFSGFDPVAVASLGPLDIDRLAQDTRIIRNRRKIEATVANAQTLLELDQAHGSFKRYLDAHDGFEATAADIVRRFKFLGDNGAYYFLYVVGEPVPPHDQWMATHRPRSR
jgi:DNA-3-methyladenine glycosylase I